MYTKKSDIIEPLGFCIQQIVQKQNNKILFYTGSVMFIFLAKP